MCIQLFMWLVFFSIFFIVGLCIGSFLNVLIERIPRAESVIKGRSHCDSCHHVLAWYDLVPLFSFLFLKGRCRYCRKKIGIQAIGVELLTGILFASAFSLVFFQVSPLLPFVISLCLTLFILSCFLVIAFIDMRHGIIPNVIVYPALLVTLSFHLFFFSTFFPFFFSSLIAGFFFFLLFVLTKGRGMGFGDVKLALLLGLFLGFPNIVIALYIAFLTGAFVAFILVLAKKKKFSGSTIPFGPFLISGAIIALFFGNFLWSHILYLFF